MPDLQSELSKLATEWDAHEAAIRAPNQTQPQQEKTTMSTTSHRAPAPIRNNVMRTCFDTVWKMPGKRVSELADFLSKQGFKATSTSSVFAQLVRTGQAIKAADGTLHPNPAVKEYRPIALPVLKKRKAASAGIAALKGGTAATVSVNTEDKRGLSTIIVSRNWTPESVLDKLTLPQAKALYAALHVYFGK